METALIWTGAVALVTYAAGAPLAVACCMLATGSYGGPLWARLALALAGGLTWPAAAVVLMAVAVLDPPELRDGEEAKE